VGVCACVCMGVFERERERERGSCFVDGQAKRWVGVRVEVGVDVGGCACVYAGGCVCEREKEKEIVSAKGEILSLCLSPPFPHPPPTSMYTCACAGRCLWLCLYLCLRHCLCLCLFVWLNTHERRLRER